MLVDRSTDWAERWYPGGEDRFGGVLVDLPFTILVSLAEAVLVLFVSAYWLLLRPSLGQFVRSPVPERRHADLEALGANVSQAIGGYFRGEGLMAVVVATIVYIGLRVIGVEYALVLALIVAVGELVPIAGPFIAAIPAVGVALLDSPTQAAIVLVFYVIVQQIESNILLPAVMQRQVHVSPVLALVALYAGGAIGGVLGAVIAVPLAGAARVLAIHFAVPSIRRWSGATVR
jgi:predicted PurR-regulated permease PerM